MANHFMEVWIGTRGIFCDKNVRVRLFYLKGFVDFENPQKLPTRFSCKFLLAVACTVGPL